MSITQLGLYNAALGILGERPLTALTDDGEPRLLLDDVWSRNDGAIKFCLEQGLWNFATRTQQIDSDTSVTPSFGYSSAFVIPSDLVKLSMISANEYFDPPLTRYEEEAGYWFADVDPLYVSFVSNDTSGYGGDMSMWPPTFARFVASYLAEEIAMRLTGDDKKAAYAAQKAKDALTDARSKDAQRGPTRFTPRGSWANARSGGWGRSTERGRRNTFLG